MFHFCVAFQRCRHKNATNNHVISFIHIYPRKVFALIQCVPQKGYPLMNHGQECVKPHCIAKISQTGLHEYRQRRANTCIKILCYDF